MYRSRPPRGAMPKRRWKSGSSGFRVGEKYCTHDQKLWRNGRKSGVFGARSRVKISTSAMEEDGRLQMLPIAEAIGVFFPPTHPARPDSPARLAQRGVGDCPGARSRPRRAFKRRDGRGPPPAACRTGVRWRPRAARSSSGRRGSSGRRRSRRDRGPSPG